MYTTGVRLKLV